MTLASIWLDLAIWPRHLDGEVGEVALRVRPIFGAAGTLLVGALLLGLVLWIYRRAGVDLSPRRRTALLALRIAAVLCLVPALLALSVRVPLQRLVKPVLALAVDTSQSMALSDAYVTPDERTALAEAVGQSTGEGSDQTELPRIDLVRLMLSADEGSRLARLRENCEVRPFAIDQRVRTPDQTDWSSSLEWAEPTGESTALARTVTEVIDQLRGQPSAGVLLLSDGANNAGASPLAACEDWRRAGAIIHTVAIGDPDPVDIEVRQVLANDLLFMGDPATVIVRLRQRGCSGLSLPLVLSRGDNELARTDVTFTDEAEINVPLTFTPAQAGDHTFRVSCPAQPGETVEQNNQHRFAARVTSDRVRVLYLEHTPRWQYRFLRDAMNRDRRLRIEILLTGAEPVAEPPPPFVNTLPASKEAYTTYDLIILGDVAPQTLTQQQMEWIAEAVRDDGVGLLLFAGPRFNPAAYVETPLADLFPVEPEVTVETSSERPRATEEDRFVPRLTPLGQSHPALQLGDSVDETIETWDALPAVYWHAPVRKARPGASVLAVHPDEYTTARPPKPLPVLAVQHFGKGPSMYCGIDETWRWRLKQGDRIFYRLWGQVIQYLGAQHLAGGQDQSSLRADRPLYGRGETALVTARIAEIGGAELPPLVVEQPDGSQERHTLRPAPGAEQLYEARVDLPAAGMYRMWIEGRALEASTSVEVEAPRLELQDPAANVTLMRELASNTGGEFCRPEGFDEMIDRLDLSPRQVNEQHNIPLWDRPLLVFLFVGLLGAEWIARRLWQLP